MNTNQASFNTVLKQLLDTATYMNMNISDGSNSYSADWMENYEHVGEGLVLVFIWMSMYVPKQMKKIINVLIFCDAIPNRLTGRLYNCNQAGLQRSSLQMLRGVQKILYQQQP